MRIDFLPILLFIVPPLGAGLGCAPRQLGTGDNVVFVVRGANGHNGGIAGIMRQVHTARPDASVQAFEWGAPACLFIRNFNSRTIHNSAEEALADRLARWHAEHQHSRIDIVAHSAGCGVALGAMRRLPSDLRIGDVVLLAPSVSPQYDLAPALSRVDGLMHVFHSDRDSLFLHWRTSTFGTYDGVKSPAAGNVGFTGTEQLPEPLRAKLVQHPYDPDWTKYGAAGGHFDAKKPAFVRAVIVPLLATETSHQPDGSTR